MLLGWIALVWVAATGSESHLLAGAEAFQKESYAQALVEFSVARELGAPEASWYVGAALQKLGKSEESVEAFLMAREQEPRAEDALLDFYFGSACYEARLFAAADALFQKAAAQSGARLAAEAERSRAQLRTVLSEIPQPAVVDWYLVRGKALVSQNRRALATLYFNEAAALGQRRSDHYGVAEAQKLIEPPESSGRRPSAP